MDAARVNHYLAQKQHLLPGSGGDESVQATHDVVALHATGTAGPYLSLWARVPGFRRARLDEALYERRKLVRHLCMRSTLHIIASDELPFFFQAYAGRQAVLEQRYGEEILVRAGLCEPMEATRMLAQLQRRILDAVTEQGPCTVRALNQSVPELQAQIGYDRDRPYGGQFSLGSRLVPGLCNLGLLVRARPRGSWRSNQYEYSRLTSWLPEVDLGSVSPQDARKWLVHRYLSAFGPATREDIRWWTGFAQSEVREALHSLDPELTELEMEGIPDRVLMLTSDAEKLREFVPPDGSYAFFLPGLDPYVMGYHDRSRFLTGEDRPQILDRAGNAAPTVWLNGRVVGAWGQHKDGAVISGLLAPVTEEEQPLLDAEARRLTVYLGGEVLGTPIRTPLTAGLRREETYRRCGCGPVHTPVSGGGR